MDYEDSLKYYRDLKNSLDTAFDEGKAEGKLEGERDAARRIALELMSKGIATDIIIASTGLSLSDIEQLKKDSEKK